MKIDATLQVRPLAQALGPWAPLMLGDSSKTTIARAGCMLLAIREAGLRLAGIDVDPVRLNTAGRRAHAFAPMTANAIPSKLAAIVGLAVGQRTAGRTGEPSLRDALHTALAEGVALVHVDKDKSVPDTDETGKHWLCALGIEEALDPAGRAAIVCTDSAIGGFVRLDAETLDGVAKWGEGDWRRYAVREVIPLRRLPRTRL